jgi:hypothetical protein
VSIVGPLHGGVIVDSDHWSMNMRSCGPVSVLQSSCTFHGGRGVHSLGWYATGCFPNENIRCFPDENTFCWAKPCDLR